MAELVRHINFKLTPEIEERLRKLSERMTERDGQLYGKAGLSRAIRAVVLAGLGVVEAEYKATTAKGRRNA